MLRKILFTFSILLITFSVAAQQKLTSIQGDFVQQKTTKMLGEKLVSKGRMSYQAPDKLQWEYITPKPYTLIIDGRKIFLKKGNQKYVTDMSKNKKFREICGLMMNSVTLAGNQPVKELPLTREMQALYKKIIIKFNIKTHLADKVTMYEKNGDTTEIIFSNLTGK